MNQHGFARSAVMLSACVLTVALVLTPFALGRTGSGGLLGLFAAAVVCLFSGLVAEALSEFISRTSPFAAFLIGMMVRMFAPLGACVALLAAGQSGRGHLPFIAYLLTFYLSTLGLETWLAVKRSANPPNSNHSPR